MKITDRREFKYINIAKYSHYGQDNRKEEGIGCGIYEACD